MDVREKIIDSIFRVVDSAEEYTETVIEKDEIELEVPERQRHGDYSSNIAMKMFSNHQPQVATHQSPRELAESIVDKLQVDKSLTDMVDQVQVAGPGFINFFLTRSVLVKAMQEVLYGNDRYGSSDIGKGKTVIVEYSSPNIAKRFGIGHLRSTVIGQALYNLYGFQGYNAVGENHLGDWGTQFGMILAQIDRKNLDANDLSVNDLEELYVEFNKDAAKNPDFRELARKWFKRLEEGNKEAKKIWRQVKETSLQEFEKIYQLLNVEIDNAHGESFYEDKMEKVISDFREKDLSKKSRGAEIVEFEDENIPPAMLLKSDGTTTYFTRDLAAVKYRKENWDPGQIIYEVGSQQKLHFRQVFSASEMVGYLSTDNLVHVAHGWYLAPDGKKFATRKGKTVRLMKVLQTAIDKAKEVIDESETSSKIGETEKNDIAKKVGVGAVKYFDLMHHPTSDIIFDWDKVIVLEGNSGPYLQYTYARTQSVLNKAEKGSHSEFNSEYNSIEILKQVQDDNELLEQDDTDLNKEELAVLRTFVHFSEVIENAAENYSPNLICNYLYELAQKYNSFYNKHRILDGEVPKQVRGSHSAKSERASSSDAQARRDDKSDLKSLSDLSNEENIGNEESITNLRLALTAATGQILKNGLTLLGIETPERM